jgi:hypothetical protein
LSIFSLRNSSFELSTLPISLVERDFWRTKVQQGYFIHRNFSLQSSDKFALAALGMLAIEMELKALYARSGPTTYFKIFIENLLVGFFFSNSSGSTILTFDIYF